MGLYDLFEVKVRNDKGYRNPYDYREIELQAEFTAPSGQRYSHFGYYDGDGSGGLSGNEWGLRFMAHEVGQWSYRYSWTDGTPGGAGSFEVVDSGLRGPLRVARDNPWYFEDARGQPFDWRGYSLHRYLHWKYGRGVFSAEAWADLREQIARQVAGRGYNVVMLGWPTMTKSGEDYNGDNYGHHFWQQNGDKVDFTRFYIPQWRYMEETLAYAGEQGVYTFPFHALVDQFTARPDEEQMKTLLRYMAARLGSYWNNFGYSITWEYQDILSHEQANAIMSELNENLKGLPLPPLLSIHDYSNNLFSGWLSFSMRQRQSRTVFDGNCRSCGKNGGVGSNFSDKPIVGSEDIWQYRDGLWDQPKTANQVRRGAWGIVLAGVMPVYMEDTRPNHLFESDGEPEIRRLYDFLYSRTKYRQYEDLNVVVNKEEMQIASGIPGAEYLVYDEDGGNITINLEGVASELHFTVLWYDPETGFESREGSLPGGAIHILTSPFSADTVLLLTR